MKLNPRVPVLREAVQKIVPMLTDRKVKVTSQGSKAYVTYDAKGMPNRVNVPYMPEDASDEFLDAIQGFLDHEVGHILFTDSSVLPKARAAKVAQLHNFIEDPFVEKSMVRRFTGSASNLGSTATFFLREVTDKMLAESKLPALSILVVPAIRAWAGQRMYQEYMDDRGHWATIKDFIDAAGPDMPAMIEACASSADCLAAAIELNKRLKAADKEATKERERPEKKKPEPKKKGKKDDKPEGEKGDEGEPGEPGEDDKDSEPGKGEPGKDSKPGKGKPEDDEDGDPPPGDDDTPLGGKPEDGSVSMEDGEGNPDEDDEFRDADDEKTEGDGTQEFDDSGKGETAEEADEGGGSVPGLDGDEGNSKEFSAGSDEPKKPSLGEAIDKVVEFDEELSKALTEASIREVKESDYVVFTTDDDVIEPLAIASPDESVLTAMVDKVDHMLGPMQKDLERAMAAQTRSVWSTGHRSGRLHTAALTRGMFGHDDLFRRREVSRSKDVAVSLVVDCSGSMMGAKIELACESAYALANVLERIGIKSEVIGFTTKPHSRAMASAMRDEAVALGDSRVRYSRTEALYMPIFKSFGERVTPLVKSRLAETGAMRAVSCSQNVDGESIIIAARRLAQRREHRKVMIVLSDGRPACSGDMSILSEHLKHAVRSIEKQGIETVGLGIMDESVRAYYPKHVLVRSVSELPTEVMRQLKKLLIVT